MLVAIIGSIVTAARYPSGFWAIVVSVIGSGERKAAALCYQEDQAFNVQFIDFETGAPVESVRVTIIKGGLDRYGQWTMMLLIFKADNLKAAALSTMKDRAFTFSFTPLEMTEDEDEIDVGLKLGKD